MGSWVVGGRGEAVAMLDGEAGKDAGTRDEMRTWVVGGRNDELRCWANARSGFGRKETLGKLPSWVLLCGFTTVSSTGKLIPTL